MGVGLDVGAAASTAASATPYGAIAEGVQAGIGAVQGIAGFISAQKNQKKLEKMLNNYQSSQSIRDYYNKALQRYSANPYTSPTYNYLSGQIKSGTAQGLQALKDRRAGIGNVSTLIQGQNDSLIKAAASADNQQAQALGQLGNATQMKDREDKYKFENLYNLYAAKAGGANQIANAGISNFYGGLQNMSNYSTARQMYQ